MKNVSQFVAVVAAMLLTVHSFAQCTPDPLYADSVYGVWPDTTQNLPGAVVGQPYDAVLNLKVPSDAGDIVPQYAGIQVDHIEITSIDNLPPGISYACNNTGCSWDALEQGCIRATGTPTAAGQYVLSINAAGYPVFVPVPIAYSFEGYRINVSPATGSETIAPQGKVLAVAQNQPNPATGQTSISFYTPSAGAIEFKLFNIVGTQLETRTIAANQGENTLMLDTKAHPNGVYLYTVTNGTESVTKRMIISHQ